MSTITPYQSAQYIQSLLPNFKPKAAIVLGSGLGGFTASLSDVHEISYQDLPGFPRTTVQGHEGKLILGYLGETPIVCLQGRAHSYEGANHQTVKHYVRTMKVLGCEYFIATNASGSLREDVGPGEIMLITDHINFQPGNPLVGPNEDDFGPRFYPLDNAYDKKLRDLLLKTALAKDINLNQGVYISVLGPNYETAAEIKAFRILGADAVGMSTVPEVLVANHCGMKVAVLAIITNYATGLATSSHSHDAVVQMAEQAASKLSLLLKEAIQSLP